MVSAAAALVVVVVVVLALVSSGDDGSPGASGATETATPAASSSPSPDEPLVESARFVNRSGGYRFSLPEDWRARKQGPTTDLRAPRRAAAMSIGPLAASSLMDASRSLIDSIRSGYREVEVEGRETSRIGELRSRALGGSAINQSGAQLRFLAIAIEGPRGFFGITVFTPQASDPAVVLPSVQTIVSSFQPLKGGS